MKKVLVIAVVTTGLLLTAAARAEDARDITVTNKTGEPIYSLFISPADSEDWEDDVLGVDVLDDGASVDVKFSGFAADQCIFDILATNEEGDGWLLPEVDLCAVSDVVITAKYIRAK